MLMINSALSSSLTPGLTSPGLARLAGRCRGGKKGQDKSRPQTCTGGGHAPPRPHHCFQFYTTSHKIQVNYPRTCPRLLSFFSSLATDAKDTRLWASLGQRPLTRP